MLALTLFVSMLVFLLMGVPVAFAIAAAALLTVEFLLPSMPLVLLPMSMFNGMDSFPMMAIPFFVLAGELMNRGGISMQLVQFSQSVVGHVRGGLGHTNIVSNAIMSSISGSALANIAAVGRVMIPAMRKDGYDQSFATSITIGASLLGPIIPPSITMVIFAVTANQSVGALFLAGIVPGLLICFGMMAVVYVRSRQRNFGTIVPFSFKRVWTEFRGSIVALFMPFIILGGIFGGIMTPTEAAAVAAFYALVVSVVFYRTITIKDLWNVALSTAKTTSFIMLVIGAARVFSDVMLSEGVPGQIAQALLGLSANPIILLLLINLLLLIVGFVMDTTAAIIILVPVLMPVAIELGIDPITFGVLMSINLVIGMATPPVGVALFLGSEVSGLRVEQIAGPVALMLTVHLAVLMLVTFVPAVSIWLPGLFGY
ncbi:TRAP transporter large permease [Roseivivax sp. THAF30]|uniref:TRAP transporter large permease n=2 Tax=unclassified Roseivivax TaxID=2639302 RepID=UPI0012685859|nr:TRAP transporter large permease [Roseivivax sp. THAF30]QFT48938.1 Sialic acid TRAP transporter permease protein SiaT [Roseivivax sp. THAF40]QFT65092.1 Sialic acid TRAP transporter permease protein SiaT [Roseivivax sp. THAF30]